MGSDMRRTAAALAALAAASTVSGASAREPGPVTADSLQRLSRQDVHDLLSRLEMEEPPEPVPGAMCYRVAGPPSVAEYTCPVCGEKTVYTDELTGFIENRLESARRLAAAVDSATAFSVTLDETAFCSNCSRDSSGNPGLFIVVEDTLRSPVSETDLRMLYGFVQGNLYWSTDTDDRLPLKDHVHRLAELLGLQWE